MGRDRNVAGYYDVQTQFQSTRPIWGATVIAIHIRAYRRDFNPRAPYGARPGVVALPGDSKAISIHAPHMGRDGAYEWKVGGMMPFQSTRPIWGATRIHRVHPAQRGISIHAPHMGRDTHCTPLCATGFYFNPRAPYGARLRLPSSTLLTMLISIHAPHMGRDDRRDGVNRRGFDFNPRAPYGARLFASL